MRRHIYLSLRFSVSGREKTLCVCVSHEKGVFPCLVELLCMYVELLPTGMNSPSRSKMRNNSKEKKISAVGISHYG